MDKDIEKEIRGTVARGWCYPKNEKKVMDTDLALAISEEVVKLFSQALEAEKAKREAMVREMIGEENTFSNILEKNKTYSASELGLRIGQVGEKEGHNNKRQEIIDIAKKYGVEV